MTISASTQRNIDIGISMHIPAHRAALEVGPYMAHVREVKIPGFPRD